MWDPFVINGLGGENKLFQISNSVIMGSMRWSPFLDEPGHSERAFRDSFGYIIIEIIGGQIFDDVTIIWQH